MLTCVTRKKEVGIERKAWSPREVADSTGLSLGFIRKEIREGGIVAVCCGRRLLITAVELQRYLTEGSRKGDESGGGN